MSRTNRVEAPTNPIQRYISFRGKEGCFAYWDKEQEANQKFTTLEIALIDVRHSVTGYHEMSQGIVSSNMISEINKESLEVRLWNKGNSTVIAKGNYKQIKDEVRGYGGKYTQNLICLVEIQEQLEVCCVQLNGSSLGNWIEFRNRANQDKIYDNWIELKQGSLCKREKGQNISLTPEQTSKILNQIQASPLGSHPILFYNVEVALGSSLNSIVAAKADEADRQLQAYFEHYKNNKQENSLGEEGSEEDDPAFDEYLIEDQTTPQQPLQQTPVQPISLTPPPLAFGSPLKPPSQNCIEYAQFIQKDAISVGWKGEGLSKFLQDKYQVTLETLATLPEHLLVKIYQEIQDPSLLEQYSEIPF